MHLCSRLYSLQLLHRPQYPPPHCVAVQVATNEPSTSCGVGMSTVIVLSVLVRAAQFDGRVGW